MPSDYFGEFDSKLPVLLKLNNMPILLAWLLFVQKSVSLGIS